MGPDSEDEQDSDISDMILSATERDMCLNLTRLTLDTVLNIS